MSRKYKFYDPGLPYFVSFATIKWIDLFIRGAYNTIIIESLKFCQENKGLIIHGWCIMTSHVHLIVSSEDKPLEDIMRDLKSYTSRKLKEEIVNHPQESRKEWMIELFKTAGESNVNNNQWQLWQQHNQPTALDNSKKLEQRLNYLHENPVAAGFVEQPQEWRYSSAVDYAGGKVLLQVKFVY
jgi:REP element-mobilizing transposase RayT